MKQLSEMGRIKELKAGEPCWDEVELDDSQMCYCVDGID